MKNLEGLKAAFVNPKTYSVPCWLYEQSSGEIFHFESGLLIAKGYSGGKTAVNDGSKEHIRNVGPIPKGVYVIGKPRHSERTGNYVLDLTPLGHNAHGRSGFQIHGDNRHGDYSASSGCIVLGPRDRTTIAAGTPLLAVF